MVDSDNGGRTEMVSYLREAVKSLIASLESGVGFDHAIYRYSQEADNELSRAFAGALEEIGGGVPRREAIRNLAQRLDVPEVTGLVEALIRADEEGTSVLQTLKEQAEQLAMDAKA